jgi:hypothetical protein
MIVSWDGAYALDGEAISILGKVVDKSTSGNPIQIAFFFSPAW